MKQKIIKISDYDNLDNAIDRINQSGSRIIQVIKYKRRYDGFYEATLLVEEYK